MSYRLLSILLTGFILSLSLFLTSCSDDDKITGPSVQPNTLQGYVKSLNGSVAISGATVQVTTVTDLDTTVMTDANGFYKIANMPSGSYKIIYTKGSFSDTLMVNVPVNAQLPDANLIPLKRLAFFWGEYDEMQNIVRSLGYGPYLDSLVLADFTDPAKLNSYAILFINCGGDARYELATPAISNNLNTFMNAGGKMYASDWAFGCVKGLHPELDGDYSGDAADSVSATVVHGGLQTALGKNNVKINYNLGAWLSLAPLNETVNIPFLKASYTVDGGTPVTNNTIAFYRNEGGSGKLLYTTFHEEAQVTTDMTKILQYFVFEL